MGRQLVTYFSLVLDGVLKILIAANPPNGPPSLWPTLPAPYLLGTAPSAGSCHMHTWPVRGSCTEGPCSCPGSPPHSR